MTTILDGRNNEDEGGGSGGGDCDNRDDSGNLENTTKMNEQEHMAAQALDNQEHVEPNIITTANDNINSASSVSPSIRQQVTSALISMKNKLTTTNSHNIVEQTKHNRDPCRRHDDAEEEEEDDDSDDDDDHYEQAVDIFVKHLDQQELERERRRRASLPADEIELTTMSAVVLRRKQQLQQLRYQHQQEEHHSDNAHQDDNICEQQGAQQLQIQQQHLMPPKVRPLSISSISSAASSNSSSSTNSSSSSGIQSSLTRNSSLNYSQEFRKQSYLASIESLDGGSQITASSSSNFVDVSSNSSVIDPKVKCVEGALKSLHLSDQLKDLALTRAAVLAAGESQRRSFGTTGNRVARINRSLHASLRYDKNTAYRIHLMANARNLMNNNSCNSSSSNTGKINASQIGTFRGQLTNPVDDDGHRFRRYSSISRNNSSTSSDSGHPRQSFRDIHLQRLKCTCQPSSSDKAADSITSSVASNSSSVLGDHQSTPTLDKEFLQNSDNVPTTVKQKAATLDGAMCRRNTALSQANRHHPECAYSKRPKRASSKLQQSPSSVSSHSNNSSLFRDDGFEDDLTSTASEHSSTIYHHQRQHNHSQHHDHHRQLFYHQNQNHQLSYHREHLQEAGLGLLTISQRVVTEIIETERSYVDDLEQIVTGYLCYLRDALKQHKELFSNLEDIHKFNKDFLFQLEECYLNPGAVAACFVENASKFDVYTHYCTMYPDVVSTLTLLMADPTTAQVLKERQLELNQSLPLGAYLLKPVQRILKYHILFKSLIKHTADDETVLEKDRELINEAFSVMTNIACHINEMKKKHEHAIRVQELQGLLCGWDGPDLTTLGDLILEDNFKLYNRQKSSRHLLLFDNVLLITKQKRDGSLCYKGHIACSNLMLIETIEGQPLVFNTVPFDNPKALSAFQADNLDRKRDWCLQMKEVIIKSFEVKIPVHVRDLLMSLTKSGNTTEVGSSKKSTASDASGKACIIAPKYLEKKRSRQEKKKQ